ncbi:MAG: four helix bundle suffix domain-containing protein [Sedimentisphaeraceae bacterium JB056]
MDDKEKLILPHGGYRNLKSFQISQLIYDITVRFCDRYIDRFSRTKDQMVQAARSGVQNIAEGSVASATSKKTELKLTNVARASLEELKLDYEDFLRQRNLPILEPDNPTLTRFKSIRCDSIEGFTQWIEQEKKVFVCDSPCKSLKSAILVANAVLSLLNLEIYLLNKQVNRLANDFETNGGFTERLYKVRKERRNKNK